MTPTLAARIRRALNPRYCWLPAAVIRPGARILDIGAGPEDGRLAKQFWPGCVFEGVNIAQPPPESGFDAYHRIDLDHGDLSELSAESFNYVVSSHLIEHLEDGLALAGQLSRLLRPGGLLYLEWPSAESLDFPIKGLGLHFMDDPTHVRTYRLEAVKARLTDGGLEILHAGRRRLIRRMVLAPLLALRRSLAVGRLVLYDFWDVTGFCLVVQARKPSPAEQAAAP